VPARERLSYSVVGLPLSSRPGCFIGTAVAGVPEQLVDATFGVRDDLCTDATTLFTTLGERAFGPGPGFFSLRTPPDLSAPIEVSLDPTPCTAGSACGTGKRCSTRTATCVLDQDLPSGNHVWSYDAALNAVRFDPTWAPTRGQSVTMTWMAATVP
jgi:hypothetical protein